MYEFIRRVKFFTASPSMYLEPVSGMHWITRLGIKMTEDLLDSMSLSLVLSYKQSRKTVKGKPKSTIIHFKLLNDIAIPPSYSRDLGSLPTTEYYA